jgi:general secretion pathway protein A
MDKRVYGFSEDPFPPTPNPKYLYLSSSHYEALCSMRAWIKEREGLMVITGEVGVGKTILLYALRKDLSKKIKTAFIFNPKLDFKDLLKNILLSLEVPIAKNEVDLKSLKLRFVQSLEERLGKNERMAIIIDEAQSLDEEVLQDLGRLLGPVDRTLRLLQILLVGQPKLEAKLNSERLRFIKDRIAIHGRICALTRQEGIGYIGHRLKLVGRDISEVFTPDAVIRIWSFAEGVPRVMNLLCDRALFIGYRTSSPIIDSKIAEEAIKGFSF